MSLVAVLVTGLVAGGASCAAVQGGLLAGVMARRSPASPRGCKPSSSEDAVPVAGFLAGKLVSHTLLGAALGLLGNAIEIGPRSRAWMQIATGVAMVLLALDLLGVKSVRRITPAPPAAWGRLVRRTGRWESATAPALLGFSTVLIPCGVTLGMEFLAIASRNALSGAAIMAVFVIGTSPLFAAIGFAARRSALALRGRLSMLAAVAVGVAGVVSLNSGLVLAGSSVTLASVFSPFAGPATPTVAAGATLPSLGADGVQRLEVVAGGGGYSPSAQRARAGVPTKLTVRANSGAGCTRSLVIRDLGVQTYLEGDKPRTIDLGKLKPGTLRFTCGMGMYAGAIEVEQ